MTSASLAGDPRVLFVTRHQSAMWAQITSHWRIAWPMSALQAQGYPVDHLWSYSAEEIVRLVRASGRREDRAPDLVIVPRLFSWDSAEAQWPDAIERWVAEMQQLGCVMVADLDDDPRYGQPDVVPATAAYLRTCDGVTVATEALADRVRGYVRPAIPVIVVPNAIRPESYFKARELDRRSVPSLTIGHASSTRHATNFEATGMAEAWGVIAERYPAVRFVLIGDMTTSGSLVELLVRWRVPRDRIVSMPMQDFERYPHALATIDIGCCPLVAEPFNRHKSPQKAWELALAGAAVVCSRTVYSDDERLVECGGLLASNAAEWVAHLSRLIDSEDERRERVASLQRFVLEERSVEANLWRWPAAWRRIALLPMLGRPRGVWQT